MKAAIVEAGLSIIETAPLAGMTVNTLSRRVNGTIPFTWPEIVRISSVTGVSCTEIVASAERIAERLTGQAKAQVPA